jgi:homeobox-leucine zipper protein
MNAKLTALNKLLVEENERLARHTSQLTLDNRMLRQQLHDLPPAAPGPDTQHSLLLNQEIQHQMKEERVNEEDNLLNALKDGGGDEKNTPRDDLSLQPIPGQNYYGGAAASTDDGSSDSVITVVGLPQNSSPQDVHSAGSVPIYSKILIDCSFFMPI